MDNDKSRAAMTRRRFLHQAGAVGLGLTGLSVAACASTEKAPENPAGAAKDTSQKTAFKVPDVLRFGVGPLLPTPADTEKAYEPFFSWLAGQLGTKHELTATDAWGGIAIALGSNQVDLAWMGPFGYVLSNDRAGAQAIATVQYDGKPIYHAIVVGRPELEVNTWPDDAKGKSISFADVGSTSGWLVPTFWFKQRRIDPKTYFQYTEGSSHAANELAVATGRVDFATDFDRQRTAMIESGKLAPEATKVVWTSDPLPNDAIGVRKGLDSLLVSRIQELILGITLEQALTILPKHYTGFVKATDDDYKSIKAAAVDLNALKR